MLRTGVWHTMWMLPNSEDRQIGQAVSASALLSVQVPYIGEVDPTAVSLGLVHTKLLKSKDQCTYDLTKGISCKCLEQKCRLGYQNIKIMFRICYFSVPCHSS